MRPTNLLLVGLVLLILLPEIYAQAIAVNPARLSFSIYRGETAEAALRISNPEVVPLNYRLTIEGNPEWFTISEPQGQLKAGDHKIIRLKLEPPGDAANGDYGALIVVQAEDPKPSPGISLGLATAIKATTTIMGKQILSLTLEAISASTTEQGLPAAITLRLVNTGNVRIKPVAAVLIRKSGRLVDSLKAELPEVLPTSAADATISIATDKLGPGNYTADVQLTQNGLELAQGSAGFEVVKYGTYTRAGNLSRLIFDGNATKPGVFKLKAIFQNNGKINERARLISEIYLDGNLVGTSESEEQLVKPGESAELFSYLNLSEPGNYRIVSRAVFEGAMTDSLELTFKLEPNNEVAVMPIGMAVGFSILSLGMAVKYRKEVKQMARKLVKEKVYYCIDCNRPIAHKGRCMSCNIRAKTHREAQDRKYE